MNNNFLCCFGLYVHKSFEMEKVLNGKSTRNQFFCPCKMRYGIDNSPTFYGLEKTFKLVQIGVNRRHFVSWKLPVSYLIRFGQTEILMLFRFTFLFFLLNSFHHLKTFVPCFLFSPTFPPHARPQMGQSGQRKKMSVDCITAFFSGHCFEMNHPITIVLTNSQKVSL